MKGGGRGERVHNGMKKERALVGDCKEISKGTSTPFCQSACPLAMHALLACWGTWGHVQALPLDKYHPREMTQKTVPSRE